MTKKDAEYNL